MEKKCIPPKYKFFASSLKKNCNVYRILVRIDELLIFLVTFEMIHQYGWALLHPTELGLQSDFSSIACQEMKRLTCLRPGWVHPENKCPAGYPKENDGVNVAPPVPLTGSNLLLFHSC